MTIEPPRIWGLQTLWSSPQLSSDQVFGGFCLQAWLAEVEGRLPARSEQGRRQSGMFDAQNPATVNSCAQDRERYSICTEPAVRQEASLLCVHVPCLEMSIRCLFCTKEPVVPDLTFPHHLGPWCHVGW